MDHERLRAVHVGRVLARPAPRQDARGLGGGRRRQAAGGHARPALVRRLADAQGGRAGSADPDVPGAARLPRPEVRRDDRARVDLGGRRRGPRRLRVGPVERCSRAPRSRASRPRCGPRRPRPAPTSTSSSSRACRRSPRSPGPRRHDWEDFRTRLAAHGPLLEELGVNFHRSKQIPLGLVCAARARGGTRRSRVTGRSGRAWPAGAARAPPRRPGRCAARGGPGARKRPPRVACRGTAARRRRRRRSRAGACRRRSPPRQTGSRAGSPSMCTENEPGRKPRPAKGRDGPSDFVMPHSNQHMAPALKAGQHHARLPASRRITSRPSARQTASRPSIDPPPT